MRLLLLIVAIHSLIFHQYRKDKKETLAPQKYNPVKIEEPSSYQYYLRQGIEINGKDSLDFSYPSRSLTYDFVNVQYLIKQAYQAP